MNNIKGIIFDLDGVLVFTDHYHYLAWKKMADSINCYFDEIINCKEPNRAMLEYIIDTVWIYHDKTVKFDLKTNINLLT